MIILTLFLRCVEAEVEEVDADALGLYPSSTIETGVEREGVRVPGSPWCILPRMLERALPTGGISV
jgi:hypothetical protein